MKILVRNIFKTRLLVNRYFSISNMERKIKVGESEINYLKIGNGNHPILCLPGIMGSIWTDFNKQIHGFDQNKYKLVVWDPPGYGDSRPPNRTFTTDYLSRDADTAAALMTQLDIKSYSILGWSDGGITGLFMASRYPEHIKKLVIWGANAYVTDEDLSICKRIKDTENWSPAMREPFEKIYGAEYLRDAMKVWFETIWTIYTEHNGDICIDELKQINIPTFILHGAKDPLVPFFHLEYLQKHIKNSRVKIFEDGKHNIHIKYAEEFNELVQKFLEENESANTSDVKANL